MEPLVAYGHYLGILCLGICLSVEWVLFRKEISSRDAIFLKRVDLGYLFAALLVLGTGFSRFFWYAKGSEYYLNNYLFTIKVSLFILIGLISIYPTIQFLKLKPQNLTAKSFKTPEKTYLRVKTCILTQLLLLPVLPFLAVLVARGYGSK